MSRGKHRKERERKPDPRYMLAYVCKLHESPSMAALEYMWGAIESKAYTPVRFVGGGERLQCYANVARRILEYGGEAVVGWAQVHGAPPLDQDNRLARYFTDTHCVWRSPEGELLDLTPGFEKAKFVADPWGSTANVSIYFLDRYIDPPAHPFGRSILVKLQKRPIWKPLAPHLLDGRTFAQKIEGRRFTDDLKQNQEINCDLATLIASDEGEYLAA